jgi:hypothetical protein
MLLLLFLLGWSLSKYRCSQLWQSQLLQWKSQEKDWQLQLESHSEMVVEKETELAQARLRLSELEMVLDLAQAKAMVSQKALGWDLQ